ncbi:hypothetical protein Taro_048003 [Colocasia esculenta]|uniref:Uncharacterized protein n=1 Tax=Colocasia esculenta TaxID=4460 RepID=A0A843X222_COLES|nr:hypothetical protein [Colocasia esculenta]
MVCGGRSERGSTLYFYSLRVYLDRIRITPSSVTYPIPFSSRKLTCNYRGKIDPGSASRYITSLLHAHVLGPVDSSKKFPLSVRDLLFDMFTHHELKRAPTFRELFDRTHKRKGTDDYVSESARMIVETYDRMMADHYAKGTPQPDLDPEALVNTAGEPKKGPSVWLSGQPRYYSSVVLIYEFSHSSGLREFVCCDARQWWRQHQNPHPRRAVAVAAAAPWHHDRATGGCHLRSRHLTASHSGQYYF